MKSLCLVFLFLLLSLDATAQRTAILGALDQEIAILLDSLKDKKEEQYGGLTFYTGNLKGQAVVIAKSGVGKVNAAYSTAILLDHFTPKQLIFTGVAGGLHPESLPGDVVIGTKLVQTDFGKPPHTVIIPGRLHFTESDALKLFGQCIDEPFDNSEKTEKISKQMMEKYVPMVREALEEITPYYKNQKEFEVILDQIMILNQKSINIDEMRWIVMMTLWKSGKENSYLFVEDSLFQNKRTELH